MEIQQETIDGQVVVHLSGRIDSTAASAFEEQMLEIINSGTNILVADFLNIQFISSAGLRVLLLAAKKVKPSGGKVILCNLSKDVQEVFNISGFSTLFEIYGSVSEAVEKSHKSAGG